MDNLTKLNLLLEKSNQAKAGGGEEKIKKQHDSGKKTARERMALLFDDGTFIETDSFLKNRNPLSVDSSYADGVVAGYGTVNGRLVYAYAQDYTVLSGSLSEMNAKKIAKVYDMAIKVGAPVVSVIDCAGVRIEDGLDALCSYNELMKKAVDASGVVPQISMVLGVCAGSMTFIPAVSDFTIMVDKTSEMYITSKEVLKAVNNESDENFPNAQFNAQTSACDVVCANEEEAFSEVKKLLSYLPSNYLEDLYDDVVNDDLNRQAADLINIIPSDDKTAYDVKDVIKTVADNCEFFEIAPMYAKNMVTGFIKLGGVAVGVVANQSLCANGEIDNLGAKKAASFIGICDSFNIPLLSLTDSEGFASSLMNEKWGMINDVAKLGFAFADATVPKVNVVVRKAYGAAYMYMNSKQLGADLSYALPTAVITASTPEVALNMLYEDEVKKADDPIKAKAEIVEKYKDEVASPYEAAKRGYIDDIVNPADLRPVLVSAFDVLMTKRVENVDKKHGNLPV